MEEPPGGAMSTDKRSDHLWVLQPTCYRSIREGGVPGRKVGRRWRSRKQAIDRWPERGGVDKATTEGGGDGA